MPFPSAAGPVSRLRATSPMASYPLKTACPPSTHPALLHPDTSIHWGTCTTSSTVSTQAAICHLAVGCSKNVNIAL